MSIEIVGVVSFVLGLLALCRGPETTVILFVPAMLLGASAAMFLAGANIQPAHLLLGFFALAVLRVASLRAKLLQQIAFPRVGFWLALATLYAVMSAFILPRLFAGSTLINAIGTTAQSNDSAIVPLAPTTGNVTQSIYIVGNFLCFVLAGALAETPRGQRTLRNALIAYVTGNILFAFADMVTYVTGTAFLLAPIRNATYQIHLDTVLEGTKRIVGSFTEAASFVSAAIGAFGFAAGLWLNGVRAPLTLPLAAVTLALLLGSTSTTAYVAVPIFCGILWVGAAFRAARGPVPWPTLAFLLIAPLIVATAVFWIVMDQNLTTQLLDTADALVFQKGVSQSGVERGAWNTMALQNFWDTNGFGGGLGSIRASSFPLAVLSNVGLAGAAALGVFLAMMFTAPASPDPGGAGFQSAAKLACLGILIAATVSGTLVDLGLPFFTFAALACSRGPGDLKQAERVRSRRPYYSPPSPLRILPVK